MLAKGPEEQRDERAEAMIEKMRDGIMGRMAQTYEESIVLKTLQMSQTKYTADD